MFHPDRPIRQTPNRFQIVRYEDDRHALPFHLLDPADAPLLEKDVADRQRLIHYQDIRIKMNGHGECETHKHSARVSFNGPIHELADFSELFDRWKALARLSVAEPKD